MRILPDSCQRESSYHYSTLLTFPVNRLTIELREENTSGWIAKKFPLLLFFLQDGVTACNFTREGVRYKPEAEPLTK
jgi:hypothetical protein